MNATVTILGCGLDSGDVQNVFLLFFSFRRTSLGEGVGLSDGQMFVAIVKAMRYRCFFYKSLRVGWKVSKLAEKFLDRLESFWLI